MRANSARWYPPLIPAVLFFRRDDPRLCNVLTGKFQEIHPAHHHVTKRRVQNIKSLISSAMRSQGLSTKLGSHCQDALLKLWDIMRANNIIAWSSLLLSVLPKTRMRQVRSVIRSSRLLNALEAESFVKTPKVPAIHLPSLEQMFRTLSKPRLATD